MPRSHLALASFLAGACVCACTASKDNSGPPDFTDGVSTLAGTAQPGYVDGDRDMARFFNPTGVAVGPDGKVYVADFDNGKVRVVEEDGTTSTLISQKGFARPFGLAFAGNTLWITTDSNVNGAHVEKKTGSVWKYQLGSDAAVEVADSIGMPRGIVALKDGRIALADYENHVIELLQPSSGEVTVIAGSFGVPGYVDGSGDQALFSVPWGMAQRADGKLVVCDHDNQRLRIVGLDGATTTLAGDGTAGMADGPMTSALFNHPLGVAADSAGNLYITDADNFRVREIRASDMTIQTIAGDGKGGYADNDDSLAAELFGMEGITVKPDGSMVYVSDGGRGNGGPYNRVRQVKMSK